MSAAMSSPTAALTSDQWSALPPPLQPRIPRPPIRIVVLCDGTAQQRNWVKTSITKDAPAAQSGDFFTNVALLAKVISSSSGLPTPTPSPLSSPVQPTFHKSKHGHDNDDAFPEQDSSTNRPKSSANGSSGGSGHGIIMPQLVFYQSGIGTGVSFLSNLVEQGTGVSLGAKIEEAYSFIVDNYQPGDEIFMFGFSRGAYTARCVSGLINWCGILSKVEMTHFSDIWSAYQRRDPDDISTDDRASQLLYEVTGKYPSQESESTTTNMYKSHLSSNLSTTANTTTSGKYTQDQMKKLLSERKQQCDARSNKVVPPQIKVVGVWDTVSALGFPGLFQDNAMIDFFDFYDPGLGSNISFAFHALSLEEDRKDFLPTLWYQPPLPSGDGVDSTNFQPLASSPEGSNSNTMDTVASTTAVGSGSSDNELKKKEKIARNSKAAHLARVAPNGVDGVAVASGGEMTTKGIHMRRKQVLKQVWFQGVHTDCGGGYQYHGLSDVTLIWMVSQLVDPHILPDGSMTIRPLLNIDLGLLESVLDRRRKWGCQIPHRSRPVINFQANRTVYKKRWDKETMSRTVWANMAQSGITNESIHPSVVVGGRIDPKTHPAFQDLRKDNPNLLETLWKDAEQLENVLRPTEKYLYWSQPQPYPAPQYDPRNPNSDITPIKGGWNLPDPTPYRQNVELVDAPPTNNTDEDDDAVSQETILLPSKELGENPIDVTKHPKFFKLWAKIYNTSNIPSSLVVDLINLRTVPRNNLTPVALQNLWWNIGDKVAGYDDDVKELFNGFNAQKPRSHQVAAMTNKQSSSKRPPKKAT